MCILEQNKSCLLYTSILSEQFDVEEDTITPETSISEDLEADSLDVVDLLMSIEDEFEIEVPDTEVEMCIRDRTSPFSMFRTVCSGRCTGGGAVRRRRR